MPRPGRHTRPANGRKLICTLTPWSTISMASQPATSNTCQPALAEFNFSIMAFLSLPNCAPEVFVHARRHVFVLIRDVFAYHLRVQEAVTANAAMPLVAGEDVRTPLGAFRVVFGMRHFQIL
jgi:hypothetical protein